MSSALEIKPCGTINRPNGTTSPQSADSNSNAPTSSQSLIGNVLHSSRHLLVDGQITPSISLIPIKQVRSANVAYMNCFKTDYFQEPSSDDYHDSSKSHRQNDQQLPAAPLQSSSPNPNVTNSSTDNATPSSSLMSLIKVCHQMVPKNLNTILRFFLHHRYHHWNPCCVRIWNDVLRHEPTDPAGTVANINNNSNNITCQIRWPLQRKRHSQSRQQWQRS